MNRIFQFEVKSGKVCLSDPCYDKETWCGKYDVPAKNGVWFAEVSYNDEGRVSTVRYAHNSIDSLANVGLTNQEFGVDSGQFGVFDSSIWEDASEWDDEAATFYGKCCDLTCNAEEGCGVVFGSGFVSSSGYGDGGYDGYLYYAADKPDELVAFYIDFCADGDEE